MCIAPLLLALTVAAAEAPFGAVSSAPLPEGSLALYGQVGYPALRVGFRQGLEGVEVGAAGEFDALRLRVAGLGSLRGSIVDRDVLRWSLDVSLGAFGVPATRASSPATLRSAGLAVEVGSTATWHTSWPVAFFAQLRIPVDLPLTYQTTAAYPSGPGARVRALLGGGAEVAVAPDLFVSFSGAFGPEVRQDRTPSAPLAVEAVVGAGWRVF